MHGSSWMCISVVSSVKVCLNSSSSGIDKTPFPVAAGDQTCKVWNQGKYSHVSTLVSFQAINITAGKIYVSSNCLLLETEKPSNTNSRSCCIAIATIIFCSGISDHL